MKKMKKGFGLFMLITCLAVCLGLISVSEGQEAVPQPGEVVNSSNIDKYKHLFPDVFIEAFKGGWGVFPPFEGKVHETIPTPTCKTYVMETEKNKGKYSIDSDGFIVGDYVNISGAPFPDIDPSDQQFVQKFMWNYEYKYEGDYQDYEAINYARNRNSPNIIASKIGGFIIFFQNRMFNDPKPYYDNPNKLRRVQLLGGVWPSGSLNRNLLMYRYVDQKRSDATYIYLPALRRTLRGEAGERSTPSGNTTQAPDDYSVFMGRIAEFDYNLVREQKILACGYTDKNYDDDYKNLLAPKDMSCYPQELDLRDTYVIDIIPKDPRYPQSVKRIWIDKENYMIYYAYANDRAGKLWKVWYAYYHSKPVGGDETTPRMIGVNGIDVQVGFAGIFIGRWDSVGHPEYTSDYAEVSVLRRMAR